MPRTSYERPGASTADRLTVEFNRQPTFSPSPRSVWRSPSNSPHQPARPSTWFRKVIEDDRQFDSTRRLLDTWNEVDGIADRATELCQALDRWQQWANGRDVTVTDLTDVATVLGNNRTIAGGDQLADALIIWANKAGLDIRPQQRAEPAIGISLDR